MFPFLSSIKTKVAIKYLQKRFFKFFYLFIFFFAENRHGAERANESVATVVAYLKQQVGIVSLDMF